MSGAGHAGGPGPRKEPGNAQTSQRHPPHTPEGEEVPPLGANAHGHDRHPAEHPPIDPESMYDRRPAEDKDREITDMP